jgi:copper chaperone NosL
MPRRPSRALAGALLLLAVTAAPPAASGAAAAAGAPASGFQGRPAQGDKCPVCGMFVAKYPDWVAAVVFEDGAVAWFDGAKDLFKFLLRPERYQRGRSPADVARVLVTDYYALTLLDARDAWFVIGGDVFGPMGAELVPFARRDDAREFQADHQGTGLLRFSDVGPATLRQLQEPE